MASLPQILITDFDRPRISYRIAANRAQRHGELLALAHRVFDKSFDEYDAHVHFDGRWCEGRAAQSEWDEGGYFGDEFTKHQGKLVVWVHFERVGEGKMESEKGKELVERIEEMKRELSCAAIRCKMEVDGANTENPAVIETKLQNSPATVGVPHPPFPGDPRTLTIDDCANPYILQHGLVIGRAKASRSLDSNRRPLVRAMLSHTKHGPSIRAYIPVKHGVEMKQRLKRTNGDMQIPLEEVDISEEFESKYGRTATAEKIKHALIKKVEDMQAAKKSESEKLGNLGNEAMKSKEYDLAEEHYAAALQLITENCEPQDPNEMGYGGGSKPKKAVPGECVTAALNEPTADLDESDLIPNDLEGLESPLSTPKDFSIVDDCTSKRLTKTGIIIGCANPSVCRDPTQRPLVRALIAEGKYQRVCAYVPTRYAKHQTRETGDVQIKMSDVNFTGQFSKIPFGEKRLDAVRKAILQKNGGIVPKFAGPRRVRYARVKEKST